MEEVWKDVAGYENLYQVSNLGRVKSLGYVRICNFGTHENSKIKRKERILKTESRVTRGRGLEIGYVRCSLHKNGVSKNYCVHKLVAQAFIPNPENKPQVDHIDTNTLNNRVDNLRWVTCLENNNNELTKMRFYEKHGVKVKELTTGLVFKTVTDCSKHFGIKRPTLSSYLNKGKSLNGYHFIKLEE